MFIASIIHKIIVKDTSKMIEIIPLMNPSTFFPNQGDGRQCNYVGPCHISNGGCSPMAVCVFNSGSVMCFCRQGYSGNGVGPHGCLPGSGGGGQGPVIPQPTSGGIITSQCASMPCLNSGYVTMIDVWICILLWARIISLKTSKKLQIVNYFSGLVFLWQIRSFALVQQVILVTDVKQIFRNATVTHVKMVELVRIE